MAKTNNEVATQSLTRPAKKAKGSVFFQQIATGLPLITYKDPMIIRNKRDRTPTDDDNIIEPEQKHLTSACFSVYLSKCIMSASIYKQSICRLCHKLYQAHILIKR